MKKLQIDILYICKKKLHFFNENLLKNFVRTEWIKKSFYVLLFEDLSVFDLQ